MEQIAELQIELRAATQEAEKFYVKGNKAAGARLRKHMQTIKGLAQAVRANVTEQKNS